MSDKVTCFPLSGPHPMQWMSFYAHFRSVFSTEKKRLIAALYRTAHQLKRLP